MKRIIGIIIILCVAGCSANEIVVNKMIDLSNKTLEEVEEYASQNNLELNIDYEFSDKEENTVINQSIDENEIINEKDVLNITISKGTDYEKLYNEYKVNELGRVPIMMYHGIIDMMDDETDYIGGNVDKDGYQRTKESFINDLEFYYNEGYRMIRLEDYVNGIIDVEAGKSPIVLTFDDGLTNNIKVLGLDENGEIIIDPSSAVGILEQFKRKYPDYNVTATFFVNGGLFRQSEYNEKILNWLIDNGYDIGNHSYTHPDFTKITSDEVETEIGKIYNILDKYIEGKYVNIVALPYGSPYKKSHENFNHVLSSNYNGKAYETISTLQVGWESNYSPFSTNFDKTFIKRIRAYDNNGTNFDIEYSFNRIKDTRYISDGDKKRIVIPKGNEDKINDLYDLEVIVY